MKTRQVPLTCNTPLAVYGAGEVGRRFAARAKKEGFRVVCFFDRNLAGSTCDELPVYSVASSLPDELERDGLVAVICLADGLQHKHVANALYEAGYRFLVFLPIGISLSPVEKDALTQLYNRVLYIRQGDALHVTDYEFLATHQYRPENVILRRDGDRIIALMDAEILFSENKSTWKGDRTKLRGTMRYSDVNIATFNFYLSLFAYLSGARNNYSEYINGFQDAHKEHSVNIASRAELYTLFCRELDRGLGFFIEAAADAEWSGAGYFNLVGGHHRTCFLFFRQHRLLPVRITEEDFERWLNRQALAKTLDLLRIQGRRELYAPVPHPTFREFPARRETHLPSVYSALCSYIGCEGLAGERVFDLCDDEGYYARLCVRLKAKDVVAYAPDADKGAITGALNELLYLPGIRVVTGLPSPGERCTFLIVMDKAIGLTPKERDELVARADALTSGRMLWESADDAFEADCRAIRSQSSFTRHKILTHLVTDGQRRTVAIFGK